MRTLRDFPNLNIERRIALAAALFWSSLLPGLGAWAEPVEAAEARKLAIELRARPEALDVHLQFKAEGDSAHVAVVADWGGSQFEDGIITDVVVEGEGYSAVSAQSPGAWVLHDGDVGDGGDDGDGKTVRLSYSIPANAFQRGTDGGSYYKPIVTPELIHLIGQQTWVLPEAWADEEPLEVTLSWSGLAEGVEAVSSFGIGPGPHHFQATKESLRRGLFVAGRGELFQGTGSDPVHFFMADGPWRFDGRTVAEMAQGIVAAERAFFAEMDAGPFLITLIPIGPKNPEHLSYGGTGLEKAFATFIVPVLELDAQGRDGLQYLLAHEKAHTWIGGRIATGEEPETAGYWFSEGVTDYYTPRLLHRSGLMSAERAIEEWNGYLRRYVLSPAFRASNQDIADGFWSDRDLQQLAYMRGAAVTFYLDQVRRHRTGGKARLDDLLLAEIDKARALGGRREMTNAELRALLTPGWTEGEISNAFATLIDGRLLELPPDVLAPCARLAWSQEVTFHLGFEHDTTSGEVLRVEQGTAAHGAGLRAGMHLGGWSIRYGDPAKEVELSVKKGDALEPMRFLPAGPKRRVPRFEVVDAEACAALM